MNKRIVILILAMISIAIFSGCVQQDAKTIDKGPGNVTPIPESTQGLKKFSSAYELREYLKASAGSTGAFDGFGGRGFFRGRIESAAVAMPVAAMPKTANAVTVQMRHRGRQDYSKTNIQVEGVDEADFVKNDGKYIYVIAQDKLVIVDAFPASDAKILSATLIEGRPKDIFVNGDRLISFSGRY